jgi:hypothetical protein
MSVMLKSMMRWKLTGAIASLLLACSLSCTAQDKGPWRAASNNAAAITGDIAIANAKVSIDFISFPLAPIRRLQPVEVSAVFDANVNAGINGDLYRLSVPAERRFLHHNTLCGSEVAEWMATYVTGRTLEVAFFSGDDAPVFTFDSISHSTAICGTFTYTR